MKFIKIVFVMLLCFSLLSSSIFALYLTESSWIKEGNEGQIYGYTQEQGLGYYLFASPYITDEDNINFDEDLLISESEQVYIRKLLNFASPDNYIYYYTGNELKYMDYNGVIKDSYTFSNSIKRMDFINIYDTNDEEILVYDGDKFYVVGMDSDFNFKIEDSIDVNIKFNAVGSYRTSKDYYNMHYALTNYGEVIFSHDINPLNLTILNLETKEEKYQSFSIDKEVFYKYNKWDEQLYLIRKEISGSANYLRVSKYDVHKTQEDSRLIDYFINGKSLTIRSGANWDFSGAVVSVKQFRLDNKPYLKINYLHDDSDDEVTLIYNLVNEEIFFEVGAYRQISVIDYDRDGNDELIINNGNGILIWDKNGFEDLYYFNRSEDIIISTLSEISVANYNDSSRMEFITPCGIYQYDGGDGGDYLNKIYDFDLDCMTTDLNFYPISLYSKEDFIKDLIINDYSNNDLYTFISSGKVSVCGDGVCELKENIITCPQDCLQPTEKYEFDISNLVINPSINGIWQNGTRFKIDYDIVPENVNVRYLTRVSLSYDDGLNYSITSNWGDLYTGTSSHTFNDYITQSTENGLIKIEVKAFGSNNTKESFYNFIVRSTGLTYGDSVYSEIPTEQTQKQDNSIYKAFVLLSSITGLSVTALYFFVIAIVSGTLFFALKNEPMTALIGSSLVGFIGVVFGVLIGTLSVSILITIIIILLIVGAVGFTNKISGER
jgi:hypothetical protein